MNMYINAQIILSKLKSVLNSKDIKYWKNKKASYRIEIYSKRYLLLGRNIII